MMDQNSSQTFRLMLLTAMVIQNSTTVLVGRYTRSSVPEEELYNVNHLIMVCEIAKFCGAAILEAKTLSSSTTLTQSVKMHVLDHPMDCLRIAVPAGLYLLQNTLLYVALSNLSAPMFQVTYQTKLLTTAVVSVVLLNRRYTPKQWIALTTLGIGVAVVILSETKVKGNLSVSDAADGQSLVTGIAAVTVACLSSAMAGVYTEMILKNVGKSNKADRPAPSLWMRNMQMAFISVCIAIIKGLWDNSVNDDGKDYLHGFSFWVWILVGLQAGGGLLVAAIIKYADNVLKGLATGVAVAFSTFCSMILFGTPLSVEFAAGATMILSSVYAFSTFGTNIKQEKGEISKVSSSSSANFEMKPILPK